ncbi:MAG: DUF3795 domain-containing protein [Clostridia bacterium]|nr:DUF3795 domain-containing protein [Clostridia bacterium]
MDKHRLLGACGIYCGACDHYLSTLQEGKYLLEEIPGSGRNLIKVPCKGCKSENPADMCEWCAQCDIKLCAAKRSIDHCGLCDEFPCERMRSFRNDGLIHHKEAFKNIEILKVLGPEQWLEEQSKKWKCKSCNSSFSCYETVCHACGSVLDGYYPDKRK